MVYGVYVFALRRKFFHTQPALKLNVEEHSQRKESDNGQTYTHHSSLRWLKNFEESTGVRRDPSKHSMTNHLTDPCRIRALEDPDII